MILFCSELLLILKLNPNTKGFKDVEYGGL